MDSSVQSRKERDRQRETVVTFSNLRNHFTVSRLIGLLSFLDWTIFSFGIGFYIWAIITFHFYLLAILAIFCLLKNSEWPLSINLQSGESQMSGTFVNYF